MSLPRIELLATVSYDDQKKDYAKLWNPSRALEREVHTFKKLNRNGKIALLMGRKTWEMLRDELTSLPHLIIFLSRDPNKRRESELYDNTKCFSSMSSVLYFLRVASQIDRTFVIGGSRVFHEAFNVLFVSDIHLTRINLTSRTQSGVEDEHYFPAIPNHYSISYLSKTKKTRSKDFSRDTTTLETSFDYCSYKLKWVESDPSVSNSEQGYLDAVKHIIFNGVQRRDRTGVGTISVFGLTLRYDISECFPLFTTKKVFWRGVVEELLWILKGHTNSKSLSKKGVKIWDANGNRTFLDSRGFTDREEGDLGPIYGWQWRYFGKKYDYESNVSNKGIDQIRYILDLLRTDPHSRRMVMSAWNPVDLPDMALPPCHVLTQFYVHKNKLSCQMYQRSADMGLGVPFNVASYSLLTYMLCHLTGYEPGEFIHVIGDAHVYNNHVEGLKKQLTRTPRPMPTLRINPTNNRKIKDPSEFEFEDFQLENYHPFETIRLPMAV